MDMAKAVVATETKRVIIAVDSGKFKTKAVRMENGEVAEKFSVATNIDTTNERISTSKSSFVVTVNGKSKLIGGLSGDYSYDTTKALEVHQKATYLATSKLAPNGQTIVLAIGCPLSVWFNTEAREAYKRFMLNIAETDELDVNAGNIPIEFEVDGQSFQYNVEQILVYPETSGYLIKNEEKYTGRSIAVVDIGGLNINGIVYQPTGEDGILEPNQSTFFTINKGGNVFKTELASKLNTRFGENIQPFEMDEIYKKGFIKSNKEESKEVIKEFIDTYLNEIRQKMKAYSWNVSTLDFVFVGGGSLMFKEHILVIPEFSDAEISDSAVWDNSEGFGQATDDIYFEE